jgi:hypothetical protein
MVNTVVREKTSSGSLDYIRTTTAVSDNTSNLFAYIIGVTNTSSPRTITLKTNDRQNRRGYLICDESGNASVNNITVTAETGLINGQTSVIINKNYGQIRLYSDGSNWFSSPTNTETRSIQLSATSIVDGSFNRVVVSTITSALMLTTTGGTRQFYMGCIPDNYVSGTNISVVMYVAPNTVGAGAWTFTTFYQSILPDSGAVIGTGTANVVTVKTSPAVVNSPVSVISTIPAASLAANKILLLNPQLTSRTTTADALVIGISVNYTAYSNSL